MSAPIITFRDLLPGDSFDFVSDTMSDSFYLRCTKISSRSYKWTDPRHGEFKGQVGTIKARVYHVERASR